MTLTPKIPMTSPLSLIKKTDRALKRYPEAFAELLGLGEPDDDYDYNPLAERVGAYVPDLVRMVLDDDFNHRKEDDPAVWAPIHALKVLGALGPAKAAEPLAACLGSEDDWISDGLPAVYAAIGPSSVPILWNVLTNSTAPVHARHDASAALTEMADAHPEERASIVEQLTAFLDRPSADDNAGEEAVTTSVISNLCDLKAKSAYPAIRRVYAENRVDPQVIGLDDVERDLGMRPSLERGQRPKPRKESGVRLMLRCTACGRTREYLFPRVYSDIGTLKNKKKLEKYGPVIIPQRVICPKCGAVDQYELGSLGHIAVVASSLAENDPDMGRLLREDQRITFLQFTTRWGFMHPQEAIERYEKELRRHPDDIAVHIGFGNVMRFLGRFDEAEAEYQRAADLDPQDLEALSALAGVTAQQGDFQKATALWKKVLSLAVASGERDDETSLLILQAEESLADLQRGVIPEFAPLMGQTPEAYPASTARPSAKTDLQPKTGRNDPCPCGSGKKYKHCHGRKS